MRRGVKGLAKAIPALASLPFQAIDPVRTVGAPTDCCQIENNQCHKQEEDGYHGLLLSMSRTNHAAAGKVPIPGRRPRLNP